MDPELSTAVDRESEPMAPKQNSLTHSCEGDAGTAKLAGLAKHLPSRYWQSSQQACRSRRHLHCESISIVLENPTADTLTASEARRRRP